MRKWNSALCTLLICTLIINAMIFIDLRKLRDNHSGSISREQLDGLSAEIANMSQILDGIAKDQKWVQSASFILDKENSRNDNMVIGVKVVFSRLDEHQTPYILYSKKGTDDWEEDDLTQETGLEYSTKLLLSPFSEYDYQIVAKGEKETVGEVSPIPYNIYGLPKWNTDLKISIPNNSNALDFSIFVTPTPNLPLPEMKIVRVSLRLESPGNQPQYIDFSEEKNTSVGIWNLKWSLADASLINDYNAYIDVTYENGLLKSEPYELLKERVKYEMNKQTAKS